MQERERAVEKARKVFLLGVSTQATGEKEKCVGVLVQMCRDHRLVLHDLDPQMPGRFDITLLRIGIGLDRAAAPAGSAQGRPTTGAASRTAGDAGSRTAGGSGQGRGRTGPQYPQDLIFRTMGLPERRRWFQDPLLDRGIRHAVQAAGAYGKLLGEVRSLNASNMGIRLPEQELTDWFEALLDRPGSTVPSRSDSRTIFDDLAAHCRALYLAETERRRQAAQRRRAEEEQRRREAARAERERQAADRLQREREERRTRERADVGQPGGARRDGPVTFGRSFEHPAEARLYVRVAERRMGPGGTVRALTRQGCPHTELRCERAVRDEIEAAYLDALRDLQLAASMIRAEAARRRDETIREAEESCNRACERAFDAAVENYKG
ncbi:hypothetical protein [Deinococcus seoulensis]|nr:hypothetical protein [Deinococcus seoulensis]